MTFLILMAAAALLAWGIAALCQAFLSWRALRKYKRSLR